MNWYDLTIDQAAKIDEVADETAAYLALEELRWSGAPNCPHCGHDKAYFLTPANGTSRATGPRRSLSVRRLWKCAQCRRQFSVLTGSPLARTKVPIVLWVAALRLMPKKLSGHALARELGVDPSVACGILRRLR